MSKIFGRCHIVDTNIDKFYENVSNRIDEFQNDGQEVEVQYKMTSAGLTMVYSALILGRKEI